MYKEYNDCKENCQKPSGYCDAYIFNLFQTVADNPTVFLQELYKSDVDDHAAAVFHVTGQTCPDMKHYICSAGVGAPSEPVDNTDLLVMRELIRDESFNSVTFLKIMESNHPNLFNQLKSVWMTLTEE